MGVVITMIDKLKGVAKSTQDFASGLINWHQNANRHNPIEILKRLQREAFSDIMKLRDRQDKVERMLTFNKSSTGSPFTKASTLVRGNVDVLGAFFIVDRVDEHNSDVIQRSGIRTGIDARITFETAIREKDMFVAEFAANENGQGGALVGPLSLAKVLYEAHFTDWFSAVAIPTGARYGDLGVATCSHRERELTEYSEFGPSLLNENSGSAIGIMVKKSNLVASLARFVSDHVHSSVITRSSGTFGQLGWKLSERTKLSLLGMQRRSRSSNQKVSLGTLTLLMSLFKRNKVSEISVDEDSSPISKEKDILDGSIALMLESEPEENTRIGAWIETKNLNTRCLQWGVTMSDTPEDEFGWGLTLGGMIQGPKVLDHFQVETFLNFNLSKRFKLQPAVMFLNDGTTQFPALLLRSSWSL